MPTCFVVMGYGKKTDHHQGRSFDLDKAYQYIIRPAAQAAGYECARSDEIQHAGNINVPMYERLLHADLVIADLSTGNLNAFFELGVRYALKPRTTIVIAEKGLQIPFDMGQVVIRQYEHLGSGIDYAEVERMKTLLTETITQVMMGANADSPVYTFLHNLRPPLIEEIAAGEAVTQENEARQALLHTDNEDEKAALTSSMASLMDAAAAAREARDFKRMREILRGVMAVQGEKVDHFIVEQLALATYSSEDLEPEKAFLEAKEILQPFEPETSMDPEMLEIWASIHTGLLEFPGTAESARAALLETAIAAIEKSFCLRPDHRCAINLAYLLDLRASRERGDEAIADHVQARRLRVRALAICNDLLTQGIKGVNADAKAEREYSVRVIRAEALCGLGRREEANAALVEAKNMEPKPEKWMIEATNKRLEALHALLAPEETP